MEMILTGIENKNEYYTNHYFTSIFQDNAEDIIKRWKQKEKWYTDENIDRMLMERHLNKKARRGSSKNHIKGPKKRTSEDDERFALSFWHF